MDIIRLSSCNAARFIEHIQELAQRLAHAVPELIVLRGGQSKKELDWFEIGGLGTGSQD
jgi:hypothetical protein